MGRQKKDDETFDVDQLTPQEQRLVWFYRELTPKGQHIVFDTMRAWVATGTYTVPDLTEAITEARQRLKDLIHHRQEESTIPTGRDMPEDDWDLDT